MTFPVLHIPVLGDGMTIALNAVIHVLISHALAIGTTFMIVLFQTIHTLGHGRFWQDSARSLLGPVVVVTTSIGAVTGVGIWFITGILSPQGIGSLIHLFFWPWFIEWIAFTVEVIFLLIYYFLWDRLAEKNPRKLMFVGWGYLFVAFSSAILISGILGFMLTPDGWPQGREFVQAYFNPTFLPQCILRIAAGITMGALLAMGWTAWRYKGTTEERGRLLRTCGLVMLIAGFCTATATTIYFSRIPETYLTHWKFAVATSVWSQNTAFLPVINIVAATCLIFAGLGALLRQRKLSMILFIPCVIFSMGMVTEFERVREFVRGPYLLPGYMYANQISMVRTEGARADDNTLLNSLRWINTTEDEAPYALAGRALFNANCGGCHTFGGINDINQRLRGRTLEGVNAITSITESMVPFMPPFTGSEQERLTMSTYLYYMANKDVRPRPQLLKEKK
ncbi:cytochrome ubiquinol oxidase subunit I [Desulfovibrio gilichinskyi]|uniref:Cytochrome C oxidase, cbb3-type, subunit III n=1 Tax=Desulfovibrio gilichinskyi TaxID=1519643 RepID=A0A1X7E766_9BACT|nr:cytochrome ubiquinol oxidase subunit I [Desulfovibrio gilichinskyi]SMF28795.1 Cytochrome C oxidase, cbb3-type, subunit III [Desulfovibrio gilichinskyi]